MADSNRITKRNRSLWSTLAIFMLLLILITIALLAARLRSGSGGFKGENVISIEANENDISAAGQSNDTFQVNDTKDGEQRGWSEEKVNEIDLFSESYINSSGKISVQSSEAGTNMVAPGTSGTYNFTVKNTGSIPLNYDITIKKDTFSLEETELPIRLTLAGEDKTLVNAGTGWGTAEYNSEERLDNYTITSDEFILAGNSSDEYQLDWEWLYENNCDPLDTNFGNYLQDPRYKPEYKLTITVHAEYDTEDGKPTPDPGNTTDPGSTPDPGNTTDPGNTSDIEDTETVDRIKDQNTEDDSELGDDENDKLNSANNNNDDGAPGDTLVNRVRALLPKTGDATNVMLWIMIVLLCAAGAAVLVRIGIKARSDKK